MEEEIEFIDTNSRLDEYTGLYSGSGGGTEQMYNRLATSLPKELLDKFQIICSRVRKIDENKIPILWNHDTSSDPEAQKLKDRDFRSIFKKLVFVSQYQFLTYHLAHKVGYGESIVLKNAIEPISNTISREPITFGNMEKNKEVRLIYHTTPHRGLEILVPVFEHLAKTRPNIHLDVYSSFELYGWGVRDAQYEEIFDICRNHPQITYHGAKSNDEVREALKRSHIFAYPNIWQETSCLASIEAMSAGVLVLCPDYGALSETVGDFGITYRYNENINKHANVFATLLSQILDKYHEGTFANIITNSQMRANKVYNWNTRKNEWELFLRQLLSQENT